MINHHELNEIINDVAELVKLDDNKLLKAVMNGSNNGAIAISGFISLSMMGGDPWDGFKELDEEMTCGIDFLDDFEFLSKMYTLLNSIYNMKSDSKNEDNIIKGIQDDTQDRSGFNGFFYCSSELVEYLGKYENIGTLTRPMRTAVAECMRMMITLFLIILLAYKHGNMTVIHNLMEKYISDHEYGEKMEKINNNLIKEERKLDQKDGKLIENEMRNLLGKTQSAE